MCAVVEDHPKAALLLEEHPRLLNARWMSDETALHYLAIEGFNDAVGFLLAHGADVNVNGFGDSPLTDVAVLGRNDIAKMLLDAGADPNGALTQYGERPIHAAEGQRWTGEAVARRRGAGALRHSLSRHHL